MMSSDIMSEHISKKQREFLENKKGLTMALDLSTLLYTPLLYILSFGKIILELYRFETSLSCVRFPGFGAEGFAHLRGDGLGSAPL